MNELTSPAFALACGVRCVPRDLFFEGEGEGDERNVTRIRDRWHVNAGVRAV
jgi:hypothetical protein